MRRRQEAGFSMLEVAIVLSIVLIVSALATPSLISTMAAIKMNSTAQSFASLLQDARMRAARDNKNYAISCVQYDNTIPTGVDNCNIIFLDINGDGDLDSSGGSNRMELDIQIAGAVKFTATPPSTTVDSQLSFAPNPQAGSVTPTGMARFNTRGQACQMQGSVCPNLDASNHPTGFVYYLTSRDALGNIHYGAVSVSPAGRVKVWKFNGTSWN